MDRNTIIGLVLIFALIAGYSWWTSPSAEEREKIQQERQEQQLERARLDSLAALSVAEETVEEQANTLPSKKKTEKDVNNVFSNSLDGDIQYTTVENEVFILKFQNLGGAITSIELKDYLTWKKEKLYLFDKETQNFYISFFANKRLINSKDIYFEAVLPDNQSSYNLQSKDSLRIAMRMYPDEDDEHDKSRYIEFLYTIYGDEYMIGFQMNFVGMEDIITNQTNFIDLHWTDNLRRNEKAPNLEDPNTAVYYKSYSNKVDYLSETRDDKEDIKTPLRWVSFKQQFFSTTLIMKDEPMLNADIANYVDKRFDKETYVKTLTALIGLPYQAEPTHSINMEIYAGPNKYNILRSYENDLERLIPLGWSFFLMQWINRFAVIPVFTLLEKANLNYGLIILILTILLKVALSPITFKSYISSAKMRIIKPEVDELSKKYPKPEQAMDKQRAQMALYKKAGINQMAGCIPMLLQFPILIAMFRFFPASIELRQQPFLWADDLSSYDSILNLPFKIPFYGDHVSLFALLMAVTNLFYTRMTMSQNASASMPGMKVMMYIMPIMFLGFLNSFSAALNYYYFLSTCMTFLITWIAKKMINEDKIHKMIQENKKKPVTKSKFQQRLEAAAKQQQELQRKQNKR